MSEATATAEEVSDVVLHFSVDAMPASSALLRLASPVFNRMFTSGMKEAKQGVIEVDVASKMEFITFFNLLGPWAWSKDKVTEANVDSLLAISDYYQVEIIKQTCENLLLGLPPSGARLLQAKKHGLTRQYVRCVGAMAKRSTKDDLEVFRQSDPDILLDVAFNALQKQHMLNQLIGMNDQIHSCRTMLENLRYYNRDYFQMTQSEADQMHFLTERLVDLVGELKDPKPGRRKAGKLMLWLQHTGLLCGCYCSR